MGIILDILALILIIFGVVALIDGGVLFGLILIVVGLFLGGRGRVY